uniref:Uncharacterized protein n=1 Tax=Cuerna arida TaxID=1464854 RepID=A0A1B6GCK4_9HEMI
MVIICSYVIFTLLASTRALPTLMEDPIAKLDPEEKEVLNPLPSGVDLSSTSESWSEAVVIRMYYDCQGRLVRQELSKLRTRNEDGIQVEKLQNVLRGAPENETTKELETPISFPSLKGRFRYPKPNTTNLPERKGWQQLPRQPDQTIPSIVGPDMIIGNPVRSCPEGYNFDRSLKCRKIVP